MRYYSVKSLNNIKKEHKVNDFDEATTYAELFFSYAEFKFYTNSSSSFMSLISSNFFFCKLIIHLEITLN